MKSECPKCDGAGVIRGACLVPQSYYAPAEYEAIDCPNPHCHDGEVEACHEETDQ